MASGAVSGGPGRRIEPSAASAQNVDGADPGPHDAAAQLAQGAHDFFSRPVVSSAAVSQRVVHVLRHG